MSVFSEIERLEGAKSALAASIEGKGVTVPAGTKIDGMAALVDQIQGGGGADFYIDDASYLFYNGARIDCLEGILGLINDAKSASHMFYGCGKVYGIDVSGASISSAKDMDYMFYNCSLVSKINFGQGAIIKPSNCNNMFYNCSNLSEIILGGFDTSDVTNMKNMFYGCYALRDETLDLSQFSTAKVVDMSGMFYGCKCLKTINLQNFDTKKVAQMSQFLSGSTNVEEIIGFSFVGGAGGTGIFPCGYNSSNKSMLRRLTFKSIQQDGLYSIRAAIDIKWCSFSRSGMVEMFNSLPDISGLTLNANYKKITITGNPCVTDGTLTDEDKAIAIGKGWTIVI